MGGGLMQLVAYGAQDVYLTGNPQITFFKVVYRRYTNFSLECIELPIDTIRPGGRYSTQILRNGDLATKTYLHITTNPVSANTFGLTFDPNPINNGKIAWVRRLGHAVIRHVEVQIGGSQIDKHWGFWLDIWYELTHTDEQRRGYAKMIGDVPEMTTLVGPTHFNNGNQQLIACYDLFIPFQFWFNRNYGLALPLIALQYHEVRVYLDLEELNKLVVWSGANPPNIGNSNSNPFQNGALLVDYVYLDSEERRRFAQVGHEYLIEQLQFPADLALVGASTNSNSHLPQRVTLNFNHPCKEIIWAHRLGAYNGTGSTNSNANRFLCYSSHGDWEDALLYAAQNLIAGMFVPSTGPLNAGSITPITYTSPNPAVDVLPLPPPAVPTTRQAYLTAQAAVLGPGDVQQLTAGAGLTFSSVTTTSILTYNGQAPIDVISVNIVNNTGAPITLAGTEELGYIDSTLTLTATQPVGYSLSNFLGNSSITMTVGINKVVNAPNYVTTVQSVSISNQSLTLRDVSIPVGQMLGSSGNTWEDTRANTNGTVNPFDVTVIQINNYGARLDGAGNIVHRGNLVLNGHDRFNMREGAYFNYVQPWQHHTHTPADGINVYSFALNPEQHQPSGTCNFSRIDTSILNYTVVDPFRNSAFSGHPVPVLDLIGNTRVYVLTTNYNILRIMSGMGGLAYSN